MPSNRLLLIGKPTEILEKYLGSSNPLYMPQAIVRKVVFDKANGGKHGLGRVVIDDLPYQFTKPLAITGNTSQHQQLGDDSIVVWTDWQTEDGNAIIVPIRIDVNGQVGLYNNVNSVFDAYDQKYVADLLRNENILYTENNRDIHELLNAQGREVPKSQATNVSTDILSHPQAKSNTSDEKRLEQSRDADYLSAVERGDMATARRMVDEAAKAADPETIIDNMIAAIWDVVQDKSVTDKTAEKMHNKCQIKGKRLFSAVFEKKKTACKTLKNGFTMRFFAWS